MLLKSRYTGYVFILDHMNRIRWKAIGAPLIDEEIQYMIDNIQLVTEECKASAKTA